jgi:ABC-2 type transport system ATP-binding protein
LVALGTTAELARRLGRSQRLQIEVAPEGMPAALEVLRSSMGTADVTIAGPAQESNTFTIAGAEREAVPDLVIALVAAGVRIYRVTPQEPSLEDVYFALHGEEGEGP